MVSSPALLSYLILVFEFRVLQFAIDKVIERQADFSDSKPKDILSRHFEIHKASPEKLSFREIVGAMSINV